MIRANSLEIRPITIVLSVDGNCCPITPPYFACKKSFTSEFSVPGISITHNSDFFKDYIFCTVERTAESYDKFCQ